MRKVPHFSLVVIGSGSGNLVVPDDPGQRGPVALIESAAFGGAIVIVQVNKIVDQVRRVDIPGQWVDFVVESPKPFHLEPLFTRDPALINDLRILKAMKAMKAVA